MRNITTVQRHKVEWKDRVYIDSNGYRLRYRPDHHFNYHNWVLEHRLVYEEYYKCSLLPWAEIHHLNENKQDNRIHNLQLLSKAEHRTITAKLKRRKVEKVCHICKSTNTYYEKHRNGKRYEKWYRVNSNYQCKNCYDKMRFNKRRIEFAI